MIRVHEGQIAISKDDEPVTLVYDRETMLGSGCWLFLIGGNER